MKKLIFIKLVLLFFTGELAAQSVWSDKTRVLPEKLRQLPVGITISHDPNPAYPEKIADTFYWKHNTKATATVARLTVVEFGSFIRFDATGWRANMLMGPKEFADLFNCPKARLKQNRTYTYPKNWRLGKQAYAGDALWYIIAADEKGKLYKGTALIETEATVLTSENK